MTKTAPECASFEHTCGKWNRHYRLDSNIFGTQRMIDGMADPSEFCYKYGDNCLPDDNIKTPLIWALLQNYHDAEPIATIFLDDGRKIYIHKVMQYYMARCDFRDGREPVLSSGLWPNTTGPEEIVDYFLGGFYEHDNEFWYKNDCVGGSAEERNP